MPRSFPSSEQLFEAKYQIVDSGCWLWTAGRSSAGYAAFAPRGSGTSRAHKWAYERANGRVPKGMFLTHTCGIRHCVNPDHLEMITAAESIRRATHPAQDFIPLVDRIAGNVRLTAFGCWHWTGRINQSRYGLVWWDGRDRLAHRMAFEAIEGELTHGMVLDHLCSNRRCVNPEHLEQVSNEENRKRGSFPHRFVSPPTHTSKAGHRPRNVSRPCSGQSGRNLYSWGALASSPQEPLPTETTRERALPPLKGTGW